MKVPVHLTAYSNKNDIREVIIPDEECSKGMPKVQLLDLVFKYGQNNFQPQMHLSVSVGDVIELNHEYWFVQGLGFKKLSERDYRHMPDQVAIKPKYLRKLMGG